MVRKVQSPLLPHTPIPPSSRREFLRAASMVTAGLLGNALLPESLFGAAPTGMQETYSIQPLTGRRQYPLVILWLQGGASHFDTFDPREPSTAEEIRGPFRSISSNVPGVRISEQLPLMATRMNRVALFRNLYHRQSDHGDATRLCLTGSQQKDSPSGDSLFGKPKNKPSLVQLSEFVSRSNIGYTVFNANNERLPYGGVEQRDGLFVQCNFNSGNSYQSPFGRVEDRERLRGRIGLLRSLGGGTVESSPQVRRYDELQQRAISILDGDISGAFDLTTTRKEERERYGDNPLGNAALIGKRLVDAGAPLIFINDGFWDSHYRIREDLERLVPRLDKAASALIDDLRNRAVVVIASEFGRTPRVNGSAGRDHWPDSNFMLIAGPRIQPRVVGQVNNAGTIIGPDGQYDASLMGEAILNAAGYARSVKRGEVITSERYPTLPILAVS